jgi:site-specific DNA recombinase
MNNLKGKSAILYRRVSTSDQKIYGNSLNAQQSSLKDFCHKNSMVIIEEFQEDYSAKNFNRPEWKKLNEFSQKNKIKIDYLLVVDWDRFSRNTYEALGVINNFKQLGIEVNCIDKWIDYNDPSQIMIQLMYLGLPEVDNKVRSQKVKIGMRQGLKEGRWNSKQPIGYIKGRDEQEKPLMQLDSIKAPLIKELFDLFATGIYSQSELIRMDKFKLLNLSKSNLSRMLKNIVYSGKIKVPQLKEECEQIVKGLHKAIVDEDTFNKVQFQLGAKSRYKQKSNKYNEKLYLRGHLKCIKCGGNLTGSGSKSKTGAKHYYYHCNPKKGCNERFKVKEAHTELNTLFRQLKPSDEVCKLFEYVLEDHYKTSKESQYKKAKLVEGEIIKLESRQQKLLDKLLDDVINSEVYKNHNIKIEDELIEKRLKLNNLNGYHKNMSEYIEFGLTLIKNLESFFKQADVLVKNKLMSSIMEEKIEFDGQKYRTPKFKEGFQYIYNSVKELEVLEIKKGDELSNISPLVLEAGLEPARPQWSLDFKSNVSTNSTTRAGLKYY